MAFREDFVWGAASSAYQTEGFPRADGSGDSIWDAFCRQPGAIANGEDGSVACDGYHRFAEDIGLLASLGLSAYGAMNNILAFFGIEGPGWLLDEKWAMPAIVLVSVWKDMGFFGLILLSGMVGINRTYRRGWSVRCRSILCQWLRVRKLQTPSAWQEPVQSAKKSGSFSLLFLL